MQVLFDTDVVLDLLLEREPFAREAALLTDAVERGVLDGYVSAHAVTTVFYVVRKARANEGAARPGDDARSAVRTLLDVFRVAAVSDVELRRAADAGLADYEDAVAVEAARSQKADGGVTRNLSDFADADLPVFSPAALLLHLAEQ